jgi:hypothetical protein
MFLIASLINCSADSAHCSLLLSSGNIHSFTAAPRYCFGFAKPLVDNSILNFPCKLATLVETCNMCLPLARQHTSRPFPASHIMGRNQIDYILVSKSILTAVQQSGILSHHSLLCGDHHHYYLDFDSSILFSDPAYKIEPASVRKLCLQDPRVVTQYWSALHELLASHNVFQ